jgi:drug/metabolite transporter (DMT)-like permease
LAAAVWLGSAEAPTKLVNAGFSPFIISMGMVMGAFVARWTVPTLLKGTGFLFDDLRDKPHLIVWALLAGMLWAVGNTLTIFAVRNVGLAIAFPLWNTNSLVGLFWGWLLFKELRGSGIKGWSKVLGGAAAIVGGAAILAVATASHSDTPGKAAAGIIAALGAGVLFGTMYIPYRKAYISGMNPLSFVTIFTFGELGTVFVLTAVNPAASAAWPLSCTGPGPCSSGPSLAASAGSSAISSSNTRQSISASAAESRSPIPTSFGDWRGALWSSARWPDSTPPEAADLRRIGNHDCRRARHQHGRSRRLGTRQLELCHGSRVRPLQP